MQGNYGKKCPQNREKNFQKKFEWLWETEKKLSQYLLILFVCFSVWKLKQTFITNWLKKDRK